MSSHPGHSQAWDPHLWLKVDDTSLKSCRHCDTQEGWVCSDKNHTGQRPGGGRGCREQGGPENLQVCQSSFVIAKSKPKAKHHGEVSAGQAECVRGI